MGEAGENRFFAFAPDIQFTQKLRGVVEVAAGPERRFMTSPRTAQRIQALIGEYPGRFSEGELSQSPHADDSLRPLLAKLLVDASAATGSTLAELYERIGHTLPGRQLVFQNHGYAEPTDDFSWLHPEDHPHRYPLNLARYLVRGLDLDRRAVLDVGCGRGGTCSFFARYYAPRIVVGLDFSGACIAFCRRRHDDERLRFVRGDAALLPFADGTFDVVTNIESSHCYPTRRMFFAEVYRVLKPGGSFCYTDVFNQEAGPAYATRQLHSLGFTVECQNDITESVMHALERGYDDYERILRPMVSEEQNNAALVDEMLDAIKRIPREAYATRKAVYCAWRLSRRP